MDAIYLRNPENRTNADPVVGIALDDQVCSDLNDFLKFYAHTRTGEVPPDPDISQGDVQLQRLAVVSAIRFAASCSRESMRGVEADPAPDQLMYNGKLPYGMHIIDPQKDKERRRRRVLRRLRRL